MTEWQDISTAPRDETSIDVWVDDGDICYRVTDVWWNPDASLPDGGSWWDALADYGAGGTVNGEPRFWMPLPDAPA